MARKNLHQVGLTGVLRQLIFDAKGELTLTGEVDNQTAIDLVKISVDLMTSTKQADENYKYGDLSVSEIISKGKELLSELDNDFYDGHDLRIKHTLEVITEMYLVLMMAATKTSI